jgi:uncharacterized protein YcfJ
MISPTAFPKRCTMKKLLLLSAALVSSALSLAQEVVQVIASTPILQQVAVPRQVCAMEQQVVPAQKSGAGALMGAIAGGAMDNAVGGGAGKAAATMIGLVGGAAIGDSVESGAAQGQPVQGCRTQAVIDTRPVAYNVVCQYAGKQYSVQLPNDPATTILFQVAPVSTVAQLAPAVTYPQPVYATPNYVQPGYVVVADPYAGYYAPGYYQPNYLLPFALGLGFDIWGGGGHGHGHGHVHGHGHGHWR